MGVSLTIVLAALLLDGRAGAGTGFRAAGGVDADLSVSIQDFPDPVSPQGILNYLVMVDNLGPGSAAGVTLVQDLPFTTGAVITPSQGNCNLVGSQVQCDLEAILALGSAQVQVELVAPGTPGSHLTTATVSAPQPDPNPANNSWTESTEVNLPVFAVADASISEGDGGDTLLSFSVTLVGDNQSTATVHYATSDGTATVGDLDYDAASGTLSFDPGNPQFQVDVTIHGDTKHEVDEVFTLNLSNPVNATIDDGEGEGTIGNDDQPPAAAVGDLSLLEGDAGTTNAVFDVTLAAAAGAPVVVDYATADGTATAGVDYVAAGGTLTFSPGVTAQTVSVAVNGDTLVEPDESFVLEVGRQYLYAGATLVDFFGGYSLHVATGALSPLPASPFVAGDSPLSVTIDGAGRRAYVTVALQDAVAGYDLDAATGALTALPSSPYPAGLTPVALAVDPTDRFVYAVNLGSNDVSGYAIDPGTGALVPLPGSPFSAGTSPRAVAVDALGRFAYVANSGADSVTGHAIDPVTGVLTPVPGSPFLAGDEPSSVAVEPGSRFVYVANNGSTNVSAFAIDTATGALTSVPGSPFPGPGGGFIAAVVAEPTGRFLYAVSDASDTYGYAIDPVTGALASLPGSPFFPGGGAAAGTDGRGRYLYTARVLSGEIAGFAIDSASGVLTPLPSSPFQAIFPSSVAATSPSAAEGTATILDDDGAPPSVSIADVSVAEGDGGGTAASFSVTLSGSSGAPVNVDYATADGTASAADADYDAAAGTLTFAPGQTVQPLDVTVNGDTGFEASEGFFVNLSNPQGATLGDGEGLGTIVNDDAATAADSRLELVHGSFLRRSLAAVGVVAYEDYFRIREGARSSYEIVVDATGGDIGGSGPALERIGSDGITMVQSSVPAGAGSSRSLSFENATGSAVDEYVRVRSLGCGPDCGAEDVYLLRSYETTLQVPRFNNSASQVTVLVVQNVSERAIAGNLWFRDAGGALVGSTALSLAPRSTQTLNTAGVAPGASGTITVSHDGRYGDVAGKAVAVEPATGFTFDTEMQARPR